MKADVIRPCFNRFDTDLDDFQNWLEAAEPWSAEKTRALHLIDMIANDESLEIHTRVRAARMIYEHADGRLTVEKLFSGKIDKEQVSEWLYGE